MTRRALDAIAALAHRGPDDRNCCIDDGWAIGHTRLAIIDLAGSEQPMRSPDGRYCLTYNGEIYNYKELRSDLEKRWSFRTQGDTEVLLAGLVLDGANFLTRANGMWAFALWDTRERRLLLARDRLGKKPLYVRDGGTSFACASELSALRTLVPGMEWEEDLDSAGDFFRYGFALPGHTNWHATKEVLPGHWYEWSPGRTGRQQRYWAPETQAFDGDAADAAAEVGRLLADSTRLRLIADVDVGSFLSGGVDSSLVSTLAARDIGHRLRTFSIGFTAAGYDESWAAQRMAKVIGSVHESEMVGQLQAGDLESLITTNLGEPFADPSLLPMSVLSRLAARHTKVALSGDGGDELFAGYQRYLGRVILRWYTRLPIPLRSNLERLLRVFPEPTHHHSRSLLKKAHLFVAMAGAPETQSAPYVAPRLFTDAQIHELLPYLKGRGHAPPELPACCAIDDVHQMMHADVLAYLPQDILVKTDRASMAHSLEVRSPFLDHRLVELAMSVAGTTHVRHLRGKQLLRKGCAETIPGWVWRRRKQGFAVPVGAWFRGSLGDALERGLRGADISIQPSAAIALLNEHRSGARDHGLRLWALWSYMQWHDGNLGAFREVRREQGRAR